MKRAALVLLLALSASASARVVMMPTIPRSCGSGDNWDGVAKCLARFGKTKVERETRGVKLVSVTSDHFRVPGLYLYKADGKRWVIAGMFETRASFQVFALSKSTIGKGAAYRFDIGTVETDEDATATTRQKISVICSGTSYRCTDVVTSCERLVEGRAVETFRGKLEMHGSAAKVTGDRSRTGAYCSAPEELALDVGSDVPMFD